MLWEFFAEFLQAQKGSRNFLQIFFELRNVVENFCRICANSEIMREVFAKFLWIQKCRQNFFFQFFKLKNFTEIFSSFFPPEFLQLFFIIFTSLIIFLKFVDAILPPLPLSNPLTLFSVRHWLWAEGLNLRIFFRVNQ